VPEIKKGPRQLSLLAIRFHARTTRPSVGGTQQTQRNPGPRSPIWSSCVLGRGQHPGTVCGHDGGALKIGTCRSPSRGGSHKNVLQGLSDEVVELGGVIAVQGGEYFCSGVHHLRILRVLPLYFLLQETECAFPPFGPLGSLNSHHRRTPELVL